MEQLDLVNITSGSRSDGRIKWFTELCLGCEFYRMINGEDRCYWGIAYKAMDRTNTLPYCQLLKKASPRLAMLNLAKTVENITAN